MTIQFEELISPNPEQIEPLRNALKAFNESRLGNYSAETFMVTAYSDDGEMHGAVHGWLQFGWLYVNMLWVDEKSRRHGIGSALLDKIEAYATARGIHRSRLATSDFQPGNELYRRRGYEVYAEIPIMPPGGATDVHVEYLMWKHWSAPAPASAAAASSPP